MRLFKNPDPFTPMSLRDNKLRVDWYNADEGLHGDYDPDDPEDINLLRFDVYYKRAPHGKWFAVEDASFCTQIPADTAPEILEKALRHIFNEYADAIEDYPYHSVRNTGERLSWLSTDNFS